MTQRIRLQKDIYRNGRTGDQRWRRHDNEINDVEIASRLQQIESDRYARAPDQWLGEIDDGLRAERDAGEQRSGDRRGS